MPRKTGKTQQENRQSQWQLPSHALQLQESMVVCTLEPQTEQLAGHMTVPLSVLGSHIQALEPDTLGPIHQPELE